MKKLESNFLYTLPYKKDSQSAWKCHQRALFITVIFLYDSQGARKCHQRALFITVIFLYESQSAKRGHQGALFITVIFLYNSQNDALKSKICLFFRDSKKNETCRHNRYFLNIAVSSHNTRYIVRLRDFLWKNQAMG